MRSLLLTLCVSLFLLAACSKTPTTNDSSASSAAAPANTAAASDSAAQAQPENTSAAASPAPKPELVIPAGTSLAIRLGQELGSKVSQPGQNFSGSLAQAVFVHGERVVPAGARVSGTVVDAKPLGRFKGGALLELTLTSLSINGNNQAISTRTFVQTKKGKGKRTAILAGGGAGAGALLGGLFGGGKGAAIGAVAGAGGGAAGAAYTGNQEIVLPAESAVSFKLSHSVRVQ